MTRRSPFRYFKTSPGMIRWAGFFCIRFRLSLRNVEDLLHERGIDVSHAAVRFWRRRFGPMLTEISKRRREGIVADCLRSDGAAPKEIGAEVRQQTGRRSNNHGENSHLPFRRRERAMQRFRRMRSLQEFAAVHASVHPLSNSEPSLYSRSHFKLNRAAALAEWRGLCAG